MRQNLYQPILGLVVTITLEFLDKYRMQLSKWRNSNQDHNTLLQKFIFAFKYNKLKVFNIILAA
jgi:hypothetical protein